MIQTHASQMLQTELQSHTPGGLGAEEHFKGFFYALEVSSLKLRTIKVSKIYHLNLIPYRLRKQCEF